MKIRKKVEKEDNRSLRTLVIYGFLVFAVIFVAILIRIFSIISVSRFDGQHRFTLAVGEKDRVSGLVSFEPVTTSVSVLIFSNNASLPISDLNKKAGVIPDGFIKTSNPVDLHATVPSLLQSFMTQWNSTTHTFTYYDLLRFWFFTYKLPVSAFSVKELPADSEISVFDKNISFLFEDSTIASENISVQIINTTGEPGLGSRLERVITNLGGNVVSVKTAQTPEKNSKIQYFGDETYTLKKLRTLLRYPLQHLDKQPIAEIIIVIGEDNKNTIVY